MTEKFNLNNPILGARPLEPLHPKRIKTNKLAEFTKRSRARALAAYQGDIGKKEKLSPFAYRHSLIVDAVSEEALTSARHLSTEYAHKKGPWQQTPFWRGIQASLRSAVAHSSSAFANSFTKGVGGAVQEAELQKAFEYPGPRYANRTYLMEIAGQLFSAPRRIVLPYEEFDEDQYIRDALSGKVDALLAEADVFALTDLIVDELKRGRQKNVPNSRKLRKLSSEDIYDRITDSVVKREARTGTTDYFKGEILENRKLLIRPTDTFDEPRHALFLQLAIVGAHATWEAGQAHRAVVEGTPDRISADEDYRPLPDLIHHKYTALTAAGTSPEDAVLFIAYDLYKEIRILREEDVDPEKRVGGVNVTVPKKTPAPRKPGQMGGQALATGAVIAGVTMLAHSDAQAPGTLPVDEETHTFSGAVQDEEPVFSMRAEGGDGAIVLMADLFTRMDADPAQRSIANFVFPPRDGESQEQRANRYAQTLEFVTTKGSVLIPMNSTIEYRPNVGFFLIRPGMRQEYIASINGELFPLQGTVERTPK